MSFTKFNTAVQIRIIHIAKSQLKLSNEQYRDVLSGFVLADGTRCTSSKDLSYDQCEALIHILKKSGFKTGRLKYEEFENRTGGFATPAQMRKIEATWMTSPRVHNKTIEGMNNFIKVIAGQSHITFVKAADVNKILTAIGHIS